MTDTGQTTNCVGSPGGSIRVVLVGTTHPGNIGAAARAMKTMGLDELVLVRPRYFPHADATARASGADDVLARARVVDSLADAVETCTYVVGTSARSRHLQWPEVDAREFAVTAMTEHIGQSVAIVFGRENSGLSNEELDCCQAVLRVPANPAYSSLNLAAAVQLVAYELRMIEVQRARANADVQGSPGIDPDEAKDGVTEPATKAVTQGEMEGLFAHLERTLIDIGYFDPRSPKLLRRRLRRMFAKMAPDRAELNILRGIFGAAQKVSQRAPKKD